MVALQELGPAQAEALAEIFPYGRLEPRLDYHGGGIALCQPGEVVRVPLRERDAFRVELVPRQWQQLERPVEVVNVHVYAPHAGGGSGLLRRRRQFDDFERFLRAPDGLGAGRARVVVGDFNATPLWPVYRRMRRFMDDAAVEVARRRGERARPTWGPGNRAPRVLRIDHGFVTGVVPEGFRVLGILGSDHSAVLLDVAIGEGDFR